jgi:tRNA G37 N-methylase TrmD
MKIDYLTLFPEMFDGVLNHSILKMRYSFSPLTTQTSFAPVSKILITLPIG